MTSTSATENIHSGWHARNPAFVLPLLMDVAQLELELTFCADIQRCDHAAQMHVIEAI